MTGEQAADLLATRTIVASLMEQAKLDLAELVAIPSVADESQFPVEECSRAAQWVLDAFRAAGIPEVAMLETCDGSKAVVGHAPGPDGAPTVLLYTHYDVQPPLDDAAWQTPPFELTEVNGRWYGRGAADCKGNIVMQLTALRALRGADFPVGIKIVSEGSEEQGTGGLDALIVANPDLLRADAILVCDTGNAQSGEPTVTTSLRGLANMVVTVQTLESELHSGMFGGAAPDALAALIGMLASLHDQDGNTTISGLDSTQSWDGLDYSVDRFRRDSRVLDGVALAGAASVADMVWARPAVTVLGIDCPPVVGSTVAIQAKASARLSLRVPPGTEAPAALDALLSHLRDAAPWNARVTFRPEGAGSPFRASVTGVAYTALTVAMESAYGREAGEAGQGGSIPVCNVFAQTYPEAEVMLIGVEEPGCLIHAPNESVDPLEIENMALVIALFLRQLGASSLGTSTHDLP